MKRHMSLYLVFALAIAYTLAGQAPRAQAQVFAGKWVHEGSKGASVIEFYPGERRIIGPIRGQFRHSVVLDDGRTIQGEGSYIFRSIGPNRGWLTLTFSDGHVTHEHEHTVNGSVMSIRHHGLTRNYARQ